MRKFKLLLIAFIIIKITAEAVPAYRSARIFNQSDGNKVVYYLLGDEHYHAYYTTDGYMLTLDSAGRNMCYAVQDKDETILTSNHLAHNVLARAPEEKLFVSTLNKIDFNIVYQKKAKLNSRKKVLATDFPKSGNVRGLVLLVEFSDNSFSEDNPRDLFYRQLNDSNYTENGATGSAKYYFKDQSMNNFNPTFDVYGPIKLKKSITYYGTNNSAGTDMNTADMVVEACKYAHDSLGVDFSKYDYNNDGNVDFVYIKYAGYGESYGAPSYTIWPHASNINDWYRHLTLDDKSIGRYACSCELRGTTGSDIDNIGTFCHEFGHVLGLPDFYNTSGGTNQVGVWSIMDYGCYNNKSRTPPAYSAFERCSLGWLKYTDIDTPADYMELPELTANNFAYRLTTDKDNEYFILENRQQKGWDAALPATGMMITHVDYSSSAWANNTVNTNSSHPRYTLEPADNNNSNTEESYKGDLYPGVTNNTSFTDGTTPNSLQWDGTPTKKGVSGIQNSNGIVSFGFMMEKLKTPLALDASEVTENSFVANWESVDHVKEYVLTVKKTLPDSLKPLPLSEDFSKMTEGNYPTANSTNISDSIDHYMSNEGWTGDYIYQAGGKCRIGDYQKSGKITTPMIDLSRDSTFTVAFKARAFTGKTLNYYVSYLDASNNDNVIQKTSFKGNSTDKDIILVLKGGVKQAKISISTQNERLFIDEFRVLRGTVDSAKVWETTNPQYVFNKLTDTSYKITNLEPGFTYTYTVQALSSDSLYNSNVSNNIIVTISNNTGITLNKIDNNITVEGTVLHILTSSTIQPFIIYGLNGSVIYKGTINKEKKIKLPSSGIYIVRVGNAASKIMVR